MAHAGEDEGARFVPVRGVGVLVLLALGVLHEAHVGRDPSASRLDVPGVVVPERERPGETSPQLRQPLGRDEAGQRLDLPQLDRAVGCSDDRVDLSGGLDALKAGALAGAVDAHEGLEEEPVGQQAGLSGMGEMPSTLERLRALRESKESLEVNASGAVSAEVTLAWLEAL
jgi:hypothetical protein